MGGKFSYAQVRDALEGLQNEGHIYSTIDDQHFKVGRVGALHCKVVLRGPFKLALRGLAG